MSNDPYKDIQKNCERAMTTCIIDIGVIVCLVAYAMYKNL